MNSKIHIALPYEFTKRRKTSNYLDCAVMENSLYTKQFIGRELNFPDLASTIFGVLRCPKDDGHTE